MRTTDPWRPAAALGVAFALTFGIALGMPASAQPNPLPPDVDLTIDGRTYCGSSLHCYEVADGDPDAIGPGDDVRITFRNQADTDHSLYVTTRAMADPQRQNTAESAAITSTDRYVSPGGSDTVRFDVPEDATGVYLWCDIPGHESQGMWMLIQFPSTAPTTTTPTTTTTAPTTPTTPTTTPTTSGTTPTTATTATTNTSTTTTGPANGGGPTTDGTGQEEGGGGATPLPALVAVVALAVAAPIAAARRRHP